MTSRCPNRPRAHSPDGTAARRRPFACQSSPAQQCLELGEQLLDRRAAQHRPPRSVLGARREIRAVGWQIEDRGGGRGDRLAHAIDLVRRQNVEHHDVTAFERGREALLDIGSTPGTS
jgi:hypothetical protein